MRVFLLSIVMAGLDPAIRVQFSAASVDARVNPGHDG
jgi:hypothetical protein